MARIKSNYENSAASKAEKVLKGEADPLDFMPEYPKIIRNDEDEVIKEAESSLSLEPEKLSGTVEVHTFRRVYKIISVIVCLVLIAAMIATAVMLPRIGSENVPSNNEVPERYLEKAIEETGAVNAVAGMILDYRAFDTFGESCVLFSAVIAVFILLKSTGKENEEEMNDREFEPKNDPVLQAAAKILIPVIMIFGFYVILNGHLSAGGGFSGGAILGGGMILYLLAFGFQKAERFFNEKTFRIVVCSALTFYCLAKSYSFFTGANGIESIIPLGTPGAIISSGLILPLNICVGLIVAFTMYSFYVMFRKGNF